MSVKAIGLVWDLECPKDYNDVSFKPSHKFLLIAYADHADHNGRNIWPAVSTVAKKTGLDERTVQRLTSDLSDMGLLLDDGKGPKGTNRWYLPINAGGDKLSPPSIRRGDKNPDSLGDIPSGDIPSGDNLSPELKEPKPIDSENGEMVLFFQVIENLVKSPIKLAQIREEVSGCREELVQDQYHVFGMDKETAGVYQDRYGRQFEHSLLGILSRDVKVVFHAVEVA